MGTCTPNIINNMSAINLNAAAQAYGYNSNSRENDDEEERGEGGGVRGRSAKIGERMTFLTRALVKNNIVGQNAYLILLGLEYLCMVYYILRLADNRSLNETFKPIEAFLDVTTMNGVTHERITQIQNGDVALFNSTNLTQTADQLDVSLESRAYTHLVINFSIFGIYTFFLLTFVHRLFQIDNFDKTQEQSYILKAISLFMVLSKTIFKLPVLSSILIVIKILWSNMQQDLFFVALVINTILILEFLIIVVYSLKFFNLEVPNDDIAWSHNTSNGLYFKLMLKLTLCSQELYRGQLGDSTVCIICMAFVLVLEILIIMYRINTPNIFNSLVHDFTLFLESLIISLTIIGLLALITGRDILSTLAYLCIFIPVIIKIFYSVDQRRKVFVLFKLKNEENLSSNEYLIALTSLLKMIKRQSETDMAQLLSFTYYHKLYCYDTGCICQFFTQYCQDPLKFKMKKKRTYRGYKDNGIKLIQIQEGEDDLLHSQGLAGRSGEITGGALQLDTQNVGMLSKSIDNSFVGQTQKSQQRTQEEGVGNSRETLPSKNVAAQVTQHQNLLNQEIYDSTFDAVGQLDKFAINYDQVDLSAAQQNGFRLDEDQDSSGMMGGAGQTGNVEFKEKGVMAQFTKGQILRGNAFNGFDNNLDFKIKGEFKSPAQFKSVEESRTYFFTRLLETMFKQLESRTKKNSSFTLISIYFQFFYQHNIYMAAMNLVKLAKSLNRSTLQKMIFSVTEYYLLELIMSHFKHNTKDEIDYQAFIESSQMQQRLDWLFEDTSHEIIQFWRLFKEEQANVQRSYHLAMNISKNISLIRDYTNQLEEKQLIKDYNKYYYYAMFYQNLLNDRQAYNQMISNLRNLLMVRNIQKKNSRFGMNNQDINDIGFAIFSIEDGGVSDKNAGKFIYCNKAACQILCVSEEDVIGKSSANIMPELIRIHHDLFVKRFMQDGLTRNVGKVRNQYIRDFKGYIKPVQLFINFYYTSKFSYSFIMHMDPIQSLTYYGSTSVISTKHCMIFLCQDDNTILNMTENVKKILGLSHKRLKEEEEILGRGLKIEDVIQSYSRIENVIFNNKVTFLPNQMVKVRCFRGEVTASATNAYSKSVMQTAQDISYLPCSLTYEEMVFLKDFPGTFSEKVFVLIPNTKVPELDTTGIGLSSAINSQNNQNEQSSKDFDGFTQTKSDTEENAVNNGGMSASVSSLTSSSSMASSSGIANTKNLLFTQKSPKILNLYLTIVFGVFISFMIITSINFFIYLDKKNNVNLQIQVNQIVSQRNSFLSATMLDLKQLHLISQTYQGKNGVKPNFSNILPPPNSTNRYSHYENLLFSDEEGLQENNEKFKLNGQKYPDLTQDDMSEEIKQIKFKLISDLGRPYYQKNTLDFGIQLLISNLAMIKPEFLIKERLPMNLDEYLQGLNGTQKVSQLLKNLYYIYYNGMSQINSLTALQNELMLQNTVNTSKNNNLFINLISFISIGMITFIGVFTFPMLGKIEDRKISVLKFFNLLSTDQIQTIIMKGEEYREEFQNLQRNIDTGKRGLGGKAEDDDLDSEIYLDDQNDEQDQIAEEYGIARAKQEYPDHSEIKIEIKVNEVLVKLGDNNPISAKDSFQGSIYSKDVGKVGRSGAIGKSKFAKRSNNKKSIDTSKSPRGPVSFKGVETGKDMPSMTTSQLNQSTKRRQLGNSAQEGIRDIFKKIKQNEEQMKESSIRKKRTGKSQDNQPGATSSRRTKYASKMEEELKVGEGKQGVQNSTSLKKSHREDRQKMKASKKENADDIVKSKKNAGSDGQDGESGESSDDDDESEKKHHKRKSQSNQDNNDMDSQAQTSANNRSGHINDQLEKVALREKVKLALYVLIVLGFLNSCLIACFSLGQKTFSEDSKAVFTLTTFYHRQNCLDNLMLYSLEQFIKNDTIKYTGYESDPKGYETDAVTYYLNYCQKHETEFNEIRRDIPVFLQNAKNEIENIESSNICKTIFRASEVARIAHCESVYDEIMKRGLTSTLYTIFNYAQSINVRFQKESRTKDFLNRILYEDQKLRDLIDLVKSYIHQALQHIQIIVTDNAMSYFDGLARIYMIIYSCYMGISILLCLIFGLFVFKKLRQQIITSANILAIMPLEELESRDRTKIETFLNS